jgi:cell division transport system permease protein
MNLKPYFARHAQTLIGSLGRIAAAPMATLLTVSVIGIALALPLCLHLLVQNARAATGNWANAVDLSVYLQPAASSERAAAIAKQLRGRDDIANVRVIDKTKALAEFRQFSGFGAAVDALTDNPLPHTLIVSPSLAGSTPAASTALRQAIAQMKDVEAVQLDSDWVKRFNAILDLLRRVVVLTGTLLAFGVALIIGNTIRLDVENRRAEIEVMKLVGGTDGFARRPFLYTGAWYGLLGGLLSWVLVTAAVQVLAQPVTRLAALYGSDFTLDGLSFGAGAAVMALACALGWFGAWLAATHHIRAIEPT